MDTSLRLFITQFAGVVTATLIPVIVIAFLSIPFTLGGHLGEPRTPAVIGHMT